MIIKIKEHFSKLSPLNILVYIFSIGLIYGGFSLFMKYQAYLEYMSTTQAIAVKVRPVILGKAENTYRALSTIKSNKSIEINSKVNGIIDGIYFIEAKVGRPSGALCQYDGVLGGIHPLSNG